MSSNVLQPNPPHLTLPSHTHTHTEKHQTTRSHKCPFFLQPPKKSPIFITTTTTTTTTISSSFLSLKDHIFTYIYIYIYIKIMFIFFPDLRGLFGLCLGQSSFFTEKTGNKARTFSPSLSLSLSSPTYFTYVFTLPFFIAVVVISFHFFLSLLFHNSSSSSSFFFSRNLTLFWVLLFNSLRVLFVVRYFVIRCLKRWNRPLLWLHRRHIATVTRITIITTRPVRNIRSSRKNIRTCSRYFEFSFFDFLFF